MARNKVILLHTSKATAEAKLNEVLTGASFSKGELAMSTLDNDESLLIKNDGGAIVDFPTSAKVDEKIQEKIDEVTSTVEKNKVVAGDNSINVTTSGTNTEISVKLKADSNALKLGDDGLYVDESALVSYTGANAIAVTGDTSVKTITLKINANDKTLAQDGDGLKTTFSLKKLAAPGDQAAKYQLQAADGSPIGDTIDIPKDQFLKNVSYSAATHELVFVFETTTGENTVKVDVTDLVDEYESGDGLQSSQTGDSVTFAIKLDAAGESKYLTVGPNGLKLSGIDAAIAVETARATAAEDKIEASVGLAEDGSHITTEGNYTSGASTIAGEIAALDTQVKVNADAITGLNGKALTGITVNTVSGQVSNNVATVTINGSQIALDGYKIATGTSEEDLTIVQTDTVNAAFGKVSKAILDNEKVVAAALTQLKETLGLTGETAEYVANALANYIQDASSFNDADVKLDAAIKANADKITQLETMESNCLTGLTSTGNTITVGAVSGQSVNIDVKFASLISSQASNAISTGTDGKLYMSTTIDCGTF